LTHHRWWRMKKNPGAERNVLRIRRRKICFNGSHSFQIRIFILLLNILKQINHKSNLWPASYWMQFTRVSVVMITYMLFSLSFFYSVGYSIFPFCPLCHQVYSKCVNLVVCYRHAFLFSFLDSNNPKGSYYPIYSCYFVMYESVASDISLISIGAHSFEINCLYTRIFDRI
jgi:hypothetical protein